MSPRPAPSRTADALSPSVDCLPLKPRDSNERSSYPLPTRSNIWPTPLARATS